MLKNIDWKDTFKWAFFGAVLFCIPAFIYIVKADYTASWILFLGAILFLFANAFHNVIESKKKEEKKVWQHLYLKHMLQQLQV